MRFIDEFRDTGAARRLLAELPALLPDRPVRVMEVCGTHTHAIARSGLRRAAPEGLTLLSGPGCPVCVTSAGEIDATIQLARREGITLCTFGDMVRVPGSEGSLAQARTEGARVEVCYSPMEAVVRAEREPDREVVFVGVGFETTAPTVACALLDARRRGVPNLSVLCFHKVIPRAMLALLSSGEVRIDAFLCPGHVSVVIGSNAYLPIVEAFHVPCVIAGFEPTDVLQALAMLLRQVRDGRAEVETQYTRAVRPEGNRRAMETLTEVFEPADAQWRGIGTIPTSGLRIRDEFADMDALKRHAVTIPEAREHPACCCGDVLRGALRPSECGAFGRPCTPASPLGPCMVSSEGACAAELKYGAFEP